MELYVGQAALVGGIRRYPFDLLELLVDSSLAQDKKLAEFRAAKPDCAFSLRLPPAAVEPAQKALVERALRAAQSLGARWIVVTTGPTTTPTARNRELLQRLFESLKGEWRLAWEPRGVWGAEEAERWAEELGVSLVRDLSRDEPAPGDVVYTRLRALGFGSRVGTNAVERVAEHTSGASEVYVVIEGDGASRAAKMLKELAGAEGFDAD